uniref:Uncharacterized protein n=1 Tax=Monopterus albus TaxID=43700 RepID=A0A3Q3JE48_MONAL
MEALKLVAVLLVAVFVQVLGALGNPLSSEEEDRSIWTAENWQDYPLERGTTIGLADLIRRSKAEQFHALMGRSLGNRGEMFVGLMGRRSLGRGNVNPLMKILI